MTTTQKIDHAAEAERRINANHIIRPVIHSETERLAIAQVHATLALVEQQKRIADVLEQTVNGLTGRLIVETSGREYS